MKSNEAPAKKPRQVTVQPQEPEPDTGDPRVPPTEEDARPRRGHDHGRDERSGKDRDGLGR